MNFRRFTQPRLFEGDELSVTFSRRGGESIVGDQKYEDIFLLSAKTEYKIAPTLKHTFFIYIFSTFMINFQKFLFLPWISSCMIFEQSFHGYI